MPSSQSTSHRISPELALALHRLEAALASAGNRARMVLSDFDHTLCDEYILDPSTSDHHAQIDPVIIEAARSHRLIVATGRRAKNPTVPLLWRSGLVAPEMPAIVENGGSLVFHHNGNLIGVDLIQPQELAQLQAIPELIPRVLPPLPKGQQLVVKTGRTMVVVSLRDGQGVALPHHQAWLTGHLQEVLPAPLRVIDTRVSAIVQHRAVNKGEAFRRYLALVGIPRGSVYVVGMGDGENDEAIFAEADLRLGFSEAVTSMVDISIPEGPRAVQHVLKLVGK